ncbi:MAG: branched-chain amino acid ABC transporter permease [Tissierellia bacterium]|nr:branched-chain amino acid ABC transporter permease [Bacillota bacterium]NLL23301.1 branched-chain amino acid ABC transporter permease [Tissierellia bacterium]
MTLFLQQLVSGISIGSVYALLAVGYALVYSVFSFTNWAFDAFMVVGAFGAFYAITDFKLPIPLALLFAILFTMLVSVFVERMAYRPLRIREAPRLFMMISAMGANMSIINIINLQFGGHFRNFPQITGETLSVGGIKIGMMDVFAAVFSFITLILLWIFLYRTKMGLGIRASALDLLTSGIMGINNDMVAIIIFGISGILSGVAGVFYGIKYAVFPYLGLVTIKAMIASIIGGLGSLPGAVVGSLLLGILETLVSGYISSEWRDLFTFSLLIIVLLFMPNGLFGKSTKEKL